MTIDEQVALIEQNLQGWEESALKQICKRVKLIGKMSADDVKQLNNLAIAKGDFQEVVKTLAKATGKNIQEIEKIYQKTLIDEHMLNEPLYDFRGMKYVPFEENETLQALARAYARTTAETMINVTATKALGFVDGLGVFTDLQSEFYNVVGKATTAVSVGAQDFNFAMRDTIKQLGGSGVRVAYGSGVTRSLDSVIKQNILWGAKQVADEYEKIITDELGCDGFDVDFHFHPRPSHVFMQGKRYANGKGRTVDGVYYIGGDEADPSSPDGLSAEEALNDYGCRHYKRGVLLGISPKRYDDEELKRLNEESQKPIEVDGVSKTGYEWRQKMNEIEQLEKSLNLQKVAFQSSGDVFEAKKCEVKLKMLDEKYKNISKNTGLKANYERGKIVV